MSSTATDNREENPTETVDALTRSLRRTRAAQLDAVHQALDTKAWTRSGSRSTADWLATTSREAFGHCRQTVHLAERIQHMPHVKTAFATGDLAESALRALIECWTDTNAAAFARDEQMLLGWALRLPHRDLNMLLDTWTRHTDTDTEAAADDDRFHARTLTITKQHDGTGRLDGVLDAEGLAIVRDAIGAHSGRAADDDERTPGQRRADALVAIAKGSADQQPHIRSKKRSRPKVIATIAYHDLLTGNTGGTLDTGTGRIVVSTDTIQRLACDAGIHRYIHAPDGTTLDYGHQTRSVSDSLFDQLVARDHRCRVGDCPIGPAGCDAHHAIHWSHHGPTELDNLILACWYHHHLLHEQHWRVQPLGAGHFILIDPDGGTHELRPPMIGLTLPAS